MKEYITTSIMNHELDKARQAISDAVEYEAMTHQEILSSYEIRAYYDAIIESEFG